MINFWKVTAGMLISVILWLTIDSYQKNYSILFTLTVCTVAAVVIIGYLEPVLALIRQLSLSSQLEDEMIGILLKAAGAGLAGEFTATICNDSGNTAMGNLMRLLGSSVILWLSIPVVEALLELLQEILGML